MKIVLEERMVISKMKITVFTPTYNRAGKLIRLYESLVEQSTKDFEWLIIDDGSTDYTEQIVTNFINNNSFIVRYYKQENGGKHRAYNKALLLAESDFFICVDSDDFLERDAIKNIIEATEELEENQGIIAYKADENSKLLSDSFPVDVSFTKKYELEQVHVCFGEFTLIYPTDIAKKFPFPCFEGEKFVTEAVVYDQIDKICKMKLFPKVITVCEYQDDGYTNNLNQIMKNNPGGYCLYFMQHIDLQNSFFKKLICAGKYKCFCIFAKKNRTKYFGKYKGVVALATPLGLLFWLYYKICRGF